MQSTSLHDNLLTLESLGLHNNNNYYYYHHHHHQIICTKHDCYTECRFGGVISRHSENPTASKR